MHKERDLFFQALAEDNSLPIDEDAVELWLRDLENPLRWAVMPMLRLGLSGVLHSTWFFKRVIPIQFSAHRLLQWLICWFCKYFVTPEANRLILRHYTTESNILNFLIDNTRSETSPVQLYPSMLVDMLGASFVDHDQELFRTMRDLGKWEDHGWPKQPGELRWDNWRPMSVTYDTRHRKWCQRLDFETAHVLFMCLFCILLTRQQYRAAINGFNFDQSIAMRIGQIVGDPSLVEMAYNKYPLYLVGPWNLTQRFLMHGFFTEFLHARLERLRPAVVDAVDRSPS